MYGMILSLRVFKNSESINPTAFSNTTLNNGKNTKLMHTITSVLCLLDAENPVKADGCMYNKNNVT